MNRKQRRELRKDKNLINELYSIIVKYLPKLLDMFGNLTDIRNQSYITYNIKTICVTRLFGLLCGLTTMKRLNLANMKMVTIAEWQMTGFRR